MTKGTDICCQTYNNKPPRCTRQPERKKDTAGTCSYTPRDGEKTLDASRLSRLPRRPSPCHLQNRRVRMQLQLTMQKMESLKCHVMWLSLHFAMQFVLQLSFKFKKSSQFFFLIPSPFPNNTYCVAVLHCCLLKLQILHLYSFILYDL